VAVSHTTVATNLNQTLDVKVIRFSKFTLDGVLPVNDLAETVDLVFGQAVGFGLGLDAGFG